MARDFLKGARDEYDVIVIGSGLGGLTAANQLAKQGKSVLVLEHHYQFGGLATWFKRKGGHTFDISLHAFPHGMVKSCRRYWTREIADRIEPLKRLRFRNPEFEVETTFQKEDYTRILIEQFGVEREVVDAFYAHLEGMNFYDADTRTTGELFEEFFPGNKRVHRFLMEAISFSNGSTLEDPAITYGIVFSNFMGKGIHIFKGGADTIIGMMVEELMKNGADVRKRCLVEKILVEERGGRPAACGVLVNGSPIRASLVISNASLKNTALELLGEEYLDKDYAAQLKAVRMNHSSCQVYVGIREGEAIPEIGDIIFDSDAERFSTEALTDLYTTSRSFSCYYPDMRPHTKAPRYTIVASINSKWMDWQGMDEETYQKHKARLIEETLDALERYVPDVRKKADWLEAATPRTIHRYVRHVGGASFGTKFEGLPLSAELPERVPGLYHAGSVGIIMSGWLGTMNYGVIVANKAALALEKVAV